MKSFATLAFLSSIALASAQVTYVNGTYHCSKADATYCAGDSLTTNIIIRCNGFIGSPGNCDDNLDGEPPVGLSFAPCFQTSAISGDAACTKNCIIYGGSGSYTGPDTVVPGCIPSGTVSSITVATTLSTVTAPTSSTFRPLGTGKPSGTGSRPTSTTILKPIGTGAATGTGSPSTASSGFPAGPANNGTATKGSGSSSTVHIPVGPTTTSPVSFKSAAAANMACAGLAVIGMVFAVFL